MIYYNINNEELKILWNTATIKFAHGPEYFLMMIALY